MLVKQDVQLAERPRRPSVAHYTGG